jgi:GDP-4-dehydro-6-deoxy-D-mannose reductase
VLQVGNLEARRDFTDVRDVVRAYHLLATHGQAGQVYNIGSGKDHAVQEILDCFLSHSKVKIEVAHDPERMRPSDIPMVVCDYERLNACTGWEPAIPFEQSLVDVLNEWRTKVKHKDGM